MPRPICDCRCSVGLVQTDKHPERQTDRQSGIQKGRLAYRQTATDKSRQFKLWILYICIYLVKLSLKPPSRCFMMQFRGNFEKGAQVNL